MTPLEKFLSGNGLSEAEFARTIGVSQPYMNRLRRGVRSPSLKLALRLEEATGIPAGQFLQARDA